MANVRMVDHGFIEKNLVTLALYTNSEFTSAIPPFFSLENSSEKVGFRN